MLSKTDVHYEVVKKISVISQKGKNKTLELRYVAWNNAYPKYDIRVWIRNDDGSEMCGKGVTLTDEEFYELGVIIDQLKNKDVEQYCDEKDFQQWKKTKIEKPNQNHQNESQDQLKSERDKLKDQLKDQLKKLYKYK
ncbi:MAG: hypothetical protein IJR46_06030 [Neisseriaceae bacterium]|nr:hypothetical protein [Neisseriaceae bacterium]